MVDHPEAQNIGCKEGKGNFATSIKEFPGPPRTLFPVGQWISEYASSGAGEAGALLVAECKGARLGVMTDVGSKWSLIRLLMRQCPQPRTRHDQMSFTAQVGGTYSGCPSAIYILPPMSCLTSPEPKRKPETTFCNLEVCRNSLPYSSADSTFSVPRTTISIFMSRCHHDVVEQPASLDHCQHHRQSDLSDSSESAQSGGGA